MHQHQFVKTHFRRFWSNIDMYGPLFSFWPIAKKSPPKPLKSGHPWGSLGCNHWCNWNHWYCWYAVLLYEWLQIAIFISLLTRSGDLKLLSNLIWKKTLTYVLYVSASIIYHVQEVPPACHAVCREGGDLFVSQPQFF